MLNFSLKGAKFHRVEAYPSFQSELEEQWHACETLSAVFSVVSLVFATIDYEVRYSEVRNNKNCAVRNDVSELYRWYAFVCTVPAAYFVVKRYLVKRKWLLIRTSQQVKDQLHIRHYTRWRTWLLMLTGELLLLSLFPYPVISDVAIHFPERIMISRGKSGVFGEGPLCIFLSEILYSCMILRIFFLVRAVLNYSQFTNPAARRICRKYGEKGNLSFNIRAVARYNPITFILALYILFTAFFSITVRIYERPYENISNCYFSPVLNAIWFSIETLYAAPYGDYFTQTYVGRSLSFLQSSTALLLITIVYSLRSGFFVFSNKEEQAYENIKSSRYAARVIETWYLYQSSKLKHGVQSERTKLYQEEYWRAADLFAEKLPLISHEKGLIQVEQSQKFNRLQDIQYTLCKIDSKLATNLPRLESQISHALALLQYVDGIVNRGETGGKMPTPKDFVLITNEPDELKSLPAEDLSGE